MKLVSAGTVFAVHLSAGEEAGLAIRELVKIGLTGDKETSFIVAYSELEN